MQRPFTNSRQNLFVKKALLFFKRNCPEDGLWFKRSSLQFLKKSMVGLPIPPTPPPPSTPSQGRRRREWRPLLLHPSGPDLSVGFMYSDNAARSAAAGDSFPAGIPSAATPTRPDWGAFSTYMCNCRREREGETKIISHCYTPPVWEARKDCQRRRRGEGGNERKSASFGDSFFFSPGTVGVGRVTGSSHLAGKRLL